MCEPKNSRRQRNDDDDRHEDVADAVAESLDVGAAGLLALHGGDDVRERGAFASRGDAHDEAAIKIYGAGKKFGARFFFRRNRFAREHRFIHRRRAFDDDAIHRHALTGTKRDAVIDI